MNDLEEVKGKLKQFILSEFLQGEDPSELTDSTPLISAGVLDSVSVLRLVEHLETEHSISVAAHEADEEHLNTISDIAQLVVSKQAG